jgi:hypothetical protein
MHPSKAHHSTTQEPDSGLRLGFTDIEAVGNDQPSGVTQSTPSKLGIPSTTFDFKFARPGPQLGPEAQRMMDDLREEALRIKAKLAAEREEEKRREGEAGGGIGARKIARPKGKAGRYSEVHMAEFKKMDSIAGHASAFRAQPGRFTPVKANLKRSQSKAQLDDREDVQKKTERISEQSHSSERLENTSPAKRARKHVADDTSSARPTTADSHRPMPTTPNIPRLQTDVLASITTPTQASLARAASIKKPVTQIPTLSRSSSKPNLNATPRGLAKFTTAINLSSMPKSESKGFLRSPGKFDRVKSILRYPGSLKKSKDAPSSIPTLSRSPSKPNLNRPLPSLPTTPGTVGGSKNLKGVNFTPDTVDKQVVAIQASPSPFKSGIPRSASKVKLGTAPSSQRPIVADSPAEEVQYPSISGHPSLGNVDYPSLAGVCPLPEPSLQTASDSRPPPYVPGTFTFRSDHTINFGASPKGFGSSPGQASVRQVRQSIFPNTMPGSFPGTNKENTNPLPSVPHGMSNKKRCRVDSDDEMEEKSERSPKKHKADVAEGAMLMAPRLMAEKMAHTSKIPSPGKKKGVLSMSRLNMLARPKMRK